MVLLDAQIHLDTPERFRTKKKLKLVIYKNLLNHKDGLELIANSDDDKRRFSS